MKALLLPADPSRPVEMIEINGRGDVRQHVGGLPEATRYDYDSLLYVSDTGRIDGQPMNVRATDYIRRDSEAARQGKMIGIDPSYGLYGPVLVVGDGANGLRDVPDRLVERFAPTRDVSLGDRIREVLRDPNEDGMISIPWPRDKNGPCVVEVTQPGQERQYLSAAGIGDEGPLLDKLTEAAEFDRKGDAKHFAHITSRHVEGNIAVVPESEAQAYQQKRQSYEDMRTVINLVSEVEDRTPAEQEAIDRMTQSLDWATDRSQNWSQDRGRGR